MSILSVVFIHIRSCTKCKWNCSFALRPSLLHSAQGWATWHWCKCIGIHYKLSLLFIRKIMGKTFNNILKHRYIKTCNSWIHRVKPMGKWAVKTIDTWIRFDLLNDNRLSASETHTRSWIIDLHYQEHICSSVFRFTEKHIISMKEFSDLGMLILISRKK